MRGRAAWLTLLACVLACAVLGAALGGCPRMRSLAGAAPDPSLRPLASAAPRLPSSAAPRAAAADVPKPPGVHGRHCRGGKALTASAPAPAPVAAAPADHRPRRADPLPPGSAPPCPRAPAGRPEVLLRV
ncbi:MULTISPECIES: hypothetical protein [Streptomyces]|uniref:hypothetical protein n=1 Tax=Streptomyces TaxID=1883 RepID=UPI00085BD7A6|nr:hypothetical protein [Streptomyces sp. F-1]SFY48252.1 hypothetical protein STEPF1_01476 [Streptomyces sp. F-1]